jgi:hypothetical protein
LAQVWFVHSGDARIKFMLRISPRSIARIASKDLPRISLMVNP